MARHRWLIGHINAVELAKPMLRRNYTWQTTFYWHKPNLSRESALMLAREHGAPLHEGGKLVWYPVWPRNVEGEPARRGAGSVQETGKFD